MGLKLTELGAITTPDSADLIYLVDVSLGTAGSKKITFSDLQTAIGDVTTVSNVGVGGVGLFKQKTVNDLEFRNINAGSSKITVTLDGPNNEVDIDVAEANLTHNNLGGIGTDDHHAKLHAADHIKGGADEVDGDQVDIDFTPSNYTPTIAPAEATDLDHLTAHLAGIDNALATTGHPIPDTTSIVKGSADGTKEIRFEVDGLTTAITRVITMPDKDITLDDIADTRIPSNHASTHIRIGTDEIDGDQLDIDFIPVNYTRNTIPSEVTSVEHLTAHLSGIDTALAGITLPTADTTSIVKGSIDGTKEIRFEVDGLSTATIRVITMPDKDITLDDIADTRTPAAHASTHITNGSDEIDGDQVDIDFTPGNYTPTISPSEVTDLDHLTAHLAGIDAALATTGLPVIDTTSIVKGSVDVTKQIRFEVDGLTTSTTRVITAPDADITLLIPSNVAITGGIIDDTLIGNGTPAAGTFTQIDVDDIVINANIIGTGAGKALTLQSDGGDGKIVFSTVGQLIITSNTSLIIAAGTKLVITDSGLQIQDGRSQFSVETGLTASTTQTQGQGALGAEKSIHEVSTVANANDTITLPLAQAGLFCFIRNAGANTLQIFPAIADKIDENAVNVSITLATNSSLLCYATGTLQWYTLS